MSKIDFITPFYKQHHDRASLISGLDSLLNAEVLSVCAIPISSDRPTTETFPQIKSTSRKVTLLTADKNVQLYELTQTYKEEDVEKKEKGRFFIFDHPDYENVYVALTIESRGFYYRALWPFIKSLYPRVNTTFITHKRLQKLLEQFQINNDFSDLIITRASHRLRFEEEGKHKKLVPMVSWPGMERKEAFDWMNEHNGWFQSMQFEAKRNGSTIAEVYFNRQGVVRTNRLFTKIFDSFVQPVCKTIFENLQIFAHRSRRDSSDLSAKPLTIDFEMDQFPDVSENAKFIQAMKRLKTASVSVLHGNPYVHISVGDYYDGSTFDLWVLSTNRLVIVPQMKGSIPAIKRLINHIFDTYAEGKILDYRSQ